MIGSRGDQKEWSCNVLRNSALHSNPVNTSVSQAGSMVTRVDARVGREGLAEEQQVSQREGEESVATSVYQKWISEDQNQNQNFHPEIGRHLAEQNSARILVNSYQNSGG